MTRLADIIGRVDYNLIQIMSKVITIGAQPKSHNSLLTVRVKTSNKKGSPLAAFSWLIIRRQLIRLLSQKSRDFKLFL
jgi:hypothetical protein